MTQQELAQSELTTYLLNNEGQVTTLDFKMHLREVFPGMKWTQQWVSFFLMNQEDLYWTVNINNNGDEYRVYFQEDTTEPVEPISKSILKDLCEEFEILNTPITKTALKAILREDGFDLTNFKSVFNTVGLVHNGQYTTDNHKIYNLVGSGQHLSKTKNQVVDIRKMHKSHILNCLKKYEGKHNFDDIIADPSQEIYQLMEAYFTYDMREILEDLV